MSATIAAAQKLEFRIATEESTTLFARGINVRNQRRCPHCESIIYSRRTFLCGVCDKALPDECLFTPEQAQTVSTLLAEERQRHRAWLQRANFG